MTSSGSRFHQASKYFHSGRHFSRTLYCTTNPIPLFTHICLRALIWLCWRLITSSARHHTRCFRSKRFTFEIPAQISHGRSKYYLNPRGTRHKRLCLASISLDLAFSIQSIWDVPNRSGDCSSKKLRHPSATL